MIITTRLTMDLQQPGYPPIVNAVQSDQYSRAVCLALYSGGAAWTVPAGATVALRYTTPAGTRGYYDTLPDGSKAWAVENNEITVYIAPQMLTAVGLVPAQVEIISGSSVLGTFPFHLRVSADLAEQIKTEEDYVNWLAWMESKLEQALVDAKESGDFTGPPPTLVSKSVTYQAGSSGTTPPTGSWSSSVPSVAQGQYLWTRAILTFDTGSVTTYQVGYMGVDATVKSEAVTYQVGDSGTTPPTGAWQSTVPTVAQGKYLWTRVVRQFNSGSGVTSYSVAYMGKDGVSAENASTVTYQVGDSGTTPPTGAWQSDVPATPQGKYLWTRTVTTSNVAEPVTTYSVAHQGIDGAGTVSSVAGKSPDDSGNVPLTSADIGAATLGQVRAAAPYNLLDNSDFRNPVNQRGQTTYTGAGYSIDRWLEWSEDNVVTVNDGYVSVSYRMVQATTLDPNKEYTIVACKRDGPVYCANGNPSSGGFGQYEQGVWLEVIGGYLTACIFAGDWVWAALYEGAFPADALPEYRPKGYAAELAACNLYYRLEAAVCTVGTQYGGGTNRGIVSIVFPKMRIANPTITIKDVKSEGFGTLTVSALTAGWGEQLGDSYYQNYIIENLDNVVGQTVVICYEVDADL